MDLDVEDAINRMALTSSIPGHLFCETTANLRVHGNRGFLVASPPAAIHPFSGELSLLRLLPVDRLELSGALPSSFAVRRPGASL